MQLTSREQALLTVALDGYLKNVADGGYHQESDQMWADLYDEIIDADIDDVGEEYDPNDADVTLFYDENGKLEYDTGLINAFAKDMAEAEDEDDKRDCVTAYVEYMSDDLAWQLYHALNARFDREFERQAEAAAQRAHEDQLDLEDAINKLNTDILHGADVVVANGKVVKDRFNRFSKPEEAA